MSSSDWSTVPSMRPRTWGNSALRLAPTVASPPPTFPNGSIPMSRPPRLAPATPAGPVVPPKDEFPALCSKPTTTAAAPKPVTFSALVKKRAEEEAAAAEAAARRRQEEEAKRARDALDLRMAGIHTRVVSSSRRYAYEADYEETAYDTTHYEDDLDALDEFESGHRRYRNSQIDYDAPPEDAYEGTEDNEDDDGWTR